MELDTPASFVMIISMNATQTHALMVGNAKILLMAIDVLALQGLLVLDAWKILMNVFPPHVTTVGYAKI